MSDILSRTNKNSQNLFAECLCKMTGQAYEAKQGRRVPGSWELPIVAKRLVATGHYDAVVALGALIRGETPHFDVLAAEAAKGLALVAMDSGIPVIFGVLTCDTPDQALDRAGAKGGNKGWDAALAAIEMCQLLRSLD